MSIAALGGSSKPQTPELPAAEAHLGYRGEGLLDEVALLGGRHATLRWAVSGRRRNGTIRARGRRARHRLLGRVVIGASQAPQQVWRRHAFAFELAFEVVLVRAFKTQSNIVFKFCLQGMRKLPLDPNIFQHYRVCRQCLWRF